MEVYKRHKNGKLEESKECTNSDVNCKHNFEKIVYGHENFKSDYGNNFGALLLMISFPLTVAYNIMACTDNCSCSLFKLPCYQKYLTLSAWFNLEAYIVFLIYVLLMAYLSRTPIGGSKIKGYPLKNGERLEYITNGLFIALIFVGTCIFLQLSKIFNIVNYIDQHLLHFCVCTYTIMLSMTIYLHITGQNLPESEVNTLTIGKGHFYSIFVGRHYNPRLFGVDLKMLAYRMSLIGATIIFLVYFYINVVKNYPYVNISVLFFTIYTAIYVVWGLIYEYSWITSMEISQEGFGYFQALGYPIYSFMLGTIMKYVAERNLELSYWTLALSLVVFLLGIFFFDGANKQKDLFRQDPKHPNVAHLKTISTKRGTNLLISGFWGFVRHPNYLGDCLINASFLFFLYDTPISIYFWGTFILLAHRTTRDNKRCKQKYGSDWDIYCNIVQYSLIPYIF